MIRSFFADKTDTHLYGRGRLNLAVLALNLYIKQTGTGNNRHLNALFFRITAGLLHRTVIEGVIFLVS